MNRPFASHPMSYAAASILPDGGGQAARDQAVRDFYDAWKAEYLAPACGNGRYVVLSAIDSGNLTVSEAHGYGMMIAALMAGHDPEAQDIFDGMFAYFSEHPTALHPHLMSWYQRKACGDAQGNDSATDGDLDIAFALLLADKQWGSCGKIDYLSEALAVLADLAAGDVDAGSRYPLLGDWVTPDSPSYYASTRSSDFTTDHFASFAAAGAGASWTTLRDSVYATADAVQTAYSPATGLLPDFIVDPAGSPAPAPAYFLEADSDGAYSYNAARDPWRLATDYLVSGDARAKTAVSRINTWIRAATAEDPSAIRAGYALDGTPLPGTDYLSMAFVAPLGVGAQVDAANQAWLDSIWSLMLATPVSAEGYFENTLKLLSMIVMSGNWWAPESVGAAACAPQGSPLCSNPAAVFDAEVRLKRLDRGPGAQSMKMSGSLFFAGGAPASLLEGAQILVEDAGAGDAALFDLTEATAAIPAQSAGVCGSRDQWKVGGAKVRYRNKSGALDVPDCTPGSANGLDGLIYRSEGALDLRFQVKTKRSTIAAPAGPLRVTLVLGATAAAGAAGDCGISAELPCEGNGSSLRCR